MDGPAGKPLPEITEVSRPYWEAARKHTLIYQKCLDCGHVQFPLQTMCRSCLGSGLEIRHSSGRGTVYSYSTVYRAPSEAFRADVPYTVVLVELAEGYKMLSTLGDITPDNVQIGLPVRVTFEELNEELALPRFRRDDLE